MDQATIIRYIADTFAGVDAVTASRDAGDPEIAWGDTFFLYDPDRALPTDRRFPFATIVTKDYGEFDCRSDLDRPGVFRLNIGITRKTYQALFGTPTPASGTVDDAESIYDFTALDRLLPHPVYGKVFWVCVLNPSATTFQTTIKPLLAEAYDLAVQKHMNRARPQ